MTVQTNKCVNENDKNIKWSVLKHIIETFPVVLAFQCGRRSLGKRPENGRCSLRAFSDLAVLVWTHPVGENPDSTKPKILFFFQQRRRTFRRSGRTNELSFFLDENIYWRLFGNPVQVSLQRKLFLATGTQTRNTKKIRLIVCSFTSRFFSFLFCNSDAKGGRDQSKQTENAQRATTRTFEDVLRHKMNKIKWHGVCIVKEKKEKNKRKTKDKTNINYIYLLAHIMLRGTFVWKCW